MSTVTIVSAFISHANTHHSHTDGTYLKNGKLLLKSSTPKIIFLDEEMFAQITEEDYNPENTKLILFGKEQLYYMQYINDIEHTPYTDQPGKDTKDFFMVIWNKTEYMREAVILNTFDTEYFVWVDFGIRYVCQNSNDQDFIDKLNNMKQPISAPANKVRIGGIWNPNINYNIDITTGVCWFFAGGVFGGDIASLLLFSEEMRTACHELVTKRKFAAWEVSIWYLIYKTHPEMFDIYPSNHNDTLIDGYSAEYPVTSFM